jgi:hypothetical protein
MPLSFLLLTPSLSLSPIILVNPMSEKASSQSRRNFFHRIIHSTRKVSEGTKDGDHQAGTVVSSPVASTASPASTASGVATSDMVPLTSSDLPVQLWNRAYEELKVVEDKLVDAYERVLSRELDENTSTSLASEDQRNAIEQANPETRRSQMRELIQTGLKKTEKEAKVKQGFGNAIQGVLNVKDMIDSAVQACPQAALAWTGVSLALQVSLSPWNCDGGCLRI